MSIGALHRAVFLDRDGVINKDWYSEASGEWESPLRPADFHLIDGALEGMKLLSDSGFLLFLVSNQPSFAKGKTTLEALRGVHDHFASVLASNGIAFRDFFYSYCHPKGVVPGYCGDCPDRKPNPFFLLKAQREHGIDLSASWMVGDRETDIECGLRAGVRTIRIANSHALDRSGLPEPHAHAASLGDAARLILQ
jgi:D-glycero-D-manno-heptose 1,7-bisphosphate phosphatase